VSSPIGSGVEPWSKTFYSILDFWCLHKMHLVTSNSVFWLCQKIYTIILDPLGLRPRLPPPHIVGSVEFVVTPLKQTKHNAAQQLRTG